MTAIAPGSPTTLEVRQRPWWLTLIAGGAAMVVGAMLLWGSTTVKVDTWIVLVELLGVYWLVIGVVDLVDMFIDHTGWAWKLFTGIVSIIAGGYILMYPVASAVALPRLFVLLLGFWALFQGIIMLIMGFKGGGWGAAIVGVMGIVFGLILMGSYGMAGTGLAMLWVGAIAGIVGGAVMIWRAFQQRPAAAG
jgi:uncharacterized membrane protein HdeD (DUF308 family)